MTAKQGIKLLGIFIVALLFAACDSGSGTSSSGDIESSSSDCNAYGAGTVTDCRDGITYRTVAIGTQTWMAENLKYVVDSSWCYDDAADNCTKYGRLYQWHTAMNLDTAYASVSWGGSDVNHQGLCPEGWHLPNTDEWWTLHTYVEENNGNEGEGQSLKSISGWGYSGTDLFGFTALPAGGRYYVSYYAPYFFYQWLESTGAFWTATEKSGDGRQANCRYMDDSSGGVGENPMFDGFYLCTRLKIDGFSIRCVKN